MCKGKIKKMAIAALLLLIGLQGHSQDGNAGITQATSQVKGYFDTGCNLMYAIGAILGLVGAVKVFSKWMGGHQETQQHVAAWFGACVFLVVVATVIKSFFGV
ncbi:DUF4134 domain-containing protein [Mucilaginibacter ximonensis]|uniref:DUF4134 domain-containing protein n=1 Tax=Mucilaginibacter ximonensis TaxID=538021 RepID=A0ABW5Y986_9SPHI